MIGSRIKHLRTIKNLTQEDLAKNLGVSRQAICMWESDKRELKATMLNKIANVFGVTVDELMRIDQVQVNEREEEMGMGRSQTKPCLATKEENMKAKATQGRASFSLKAPQAKRAAVSGSFNSWDKSGIAMSKDKSGIWSTSVNLKPGRYEYKFIVDGQWITDPANSRTVGNSLGSQNSLIEVSA